MTTLAAGYAYPGQPGTALDAIADELTHAGYTVQHPAGLTITNARRALTDLTITPEGGATTIRTHVARSPRLEKPQWSRPVKGGATRSVRDAAGPSRGCLNGAARLRAERPGGLTAAAAEHALASMEPPG